MSRNVELKCRRCGYINDGTAVDPERLEHSSLEEMMKWNGQAGRMRHTLYFPSYTDDYEEVSDFIHQCPDGGIGLMDFLGVGPDNGAGISTVLVALMDEGERMML